MFGFRLISCLSFGIVGLISMDCVIVIFLLFTSLNAEWNFSSFVVSFVKFSGFFLFLFFFFYLIASWNFIYYIFSILFIHNFFF